MAAGAVDAEQRLLARSTGTSLGRQLDELLDGLEEELREALAAAPAAEAIGLGIPCTIDRERGVAINAVNLPIVDVPMRELIGDRPRGPTRGADTSRLRAR